MSRAKWPSGLRRKMSPMPIILMKATGADAGDDDDDSDDRDGGDNSDAAGEVDNGDAGGEGDASVSLLNS